jgi:trimethylamine--corrinoid protein Co-methyltransferase
MLDEMVRHGMPAIVTSAGQAGATSPVDLAGAVMQGNAEVLAAMVCMNLLSPGHPVLFGNGPFVSDLRTGAFAGGGGEMALLTAASAQMANFYDLPSGIGAGMTSSKQPDAQAGWEKGYLAALAGLAGVNMIYQSAGILADVMAISPEMMVIDAEMTAGALRAVRGIEVSDEALSVDTIAEVVAGPGHFLGHPRTLDLMETEYVYPDLACRRSIRDWEDAGSSDMRKRARARMEEILSSHYPAHVAPADDARIRDAFPINLAPEDMRPGNGRW